MMNKLTFKKVLLLSVLLLAGCCDTFYGNDFPAQRNDSMEIPQNV